MALNSKTTVKIIDLICEGPIEGVQGRKGVYLDETSAVDKEVQAENFEQRRGRLGQKALAEEKTIPVAIDVNADVGAEYSEELDADGNRVSGKDDYGTGYVIQQITDLEADSVELVFTVPRLFSTALEGLARGQLFPARIKYRIEIQNAKSSYVRVHLDEDVIEGISTSAYQFKTKKIDLDIAPSNTPGKNGPWNIKVSKLKFYNPEDAFEFKRSDLTDLPKKTTPMTGRGDKLIWTSILVHKSAKVNYAGTACASLSLDSEQFQTLPARAYDVKGLKVKIPSNATPHENGYLQFSGLPFDGQLKDEEQWTTCPVCCFYDMLVNKRYGAGDFIDADNVSWIDLIGIAKYCNQLINVETGEAVSLDEEVENPDGLYEPRFAINTVIGSQADAYSVIQDLASVFRGMVFWKSDTVQLAADHGNLSGADLDPIHIFSNSNVVGGGFVYSGSSLKTRSTRVVARYNDSENFYKPNYVIVENRNDIKKYGLQTREVVAFGCTSKTQAQRMAKWVLTSEQLEGETVTFSVGLEGLNVLPGQVFAVSDAMRQGSRLAGRVVGATKTRIVVDQNVSSLPGSNDQLNVVLPDGRVQMRSATLDGTSTITVSPGFDEPPADNAIWSITDTSVVNQKFRCLSVAEGDDGVYAIVGVQHVDNIYDVVEGRDSKLDFPDVTLFDDRPNQPEDLQIRFFDVTSGRNRFKQVNVSWSRGADHRAVKFLVRYKVTEAGNWRALTTTETNIDITKTVVAGQDFNVRVYAIGPEPKSLRSRPAIGSATAVAESITEDVGGGTKAVLPPDPEGVTLHPTGKNQITLRWSPTASGQSLHEFRAVIRHSGKTNGSAEWYESNFLEKVEARVTFATLPLMEGEYLIKFENDQGLKSKNAVSAVIDLPDQLPLFNYESIQTGANNFPGLKDGVYYDDGFDGLVLDGDASFDDEVDDVDALTANIDSIFGTQRTSGTYYFAMDFDFGAKYSPLFKKRLKSVGTYRTNTFDDRLDLIDTWADFDGDIADDVNVKVYLRTAVEPTNENVESVFTGSSARSGLLLEDDSSLLLETETESFLNASDLEFGSWLQLENTNYAGRHFQFKAVLTTDHVDQTPVVESLGVDVKFETRTETSRVLLSDPDGPMDVSFDYPFYTDSDTKASVGIVAYDMEPGDYFVLGEPDSDGFTIEFKGTFDGNVSLARRFRYTAVGYGAKQA